MTVKKYIRDVTVNKTQDIVQVRCVLATAFNRRSFFRLNSVTNLLLPSSGLTESLGLQEREKTVSFAKIKNKMYKN